MPKTITARHSRPAIYERSYCEPYAEGQEKAALDALDRAYADVKRQITGMTTIVHGEREED